MIQVRLQGAETNADGPLEATAILAGVPSLGDQIAVWIGDREGEVFVTVDVVTWPAWQYAYDPGVQEPIVFLRRADGFTDDEWRDVFKAVTEMRHP